MEIDPSDAGEKIDKLVENGDISIDEQSPGDHVHTIWNPLFDVTSNHQKWNRINRLMKATGAEWKDDSQYWMLIEY